MNNNNILGVSFSKGVSINEWVEKGLYDREIMIYKKYIEEGNFDKIYLFTYDEKLKCQLPEGIEAVIKGEKFKGKIGDWVYSFIFPLVKLREYKDVSVFKSNQTLGAWGLVLGKFFFKKKYLLRTGYTFSLFLKKRGVTGIKLKMFEFLERLCFKYSTKSTCASIQDQEYLLKKYNFLNQENLSVNKNYIDTSKFSAEREMDEREDVICFVGRLNDQKNIHNLIDGYLQSGVKIPLLIIGDGEHRDYVESQVSENIRYLGAQPNDQISVQLLNSKYFILPSHFEGMPKALLEAMASGCVCMATNVVGNNEVIDKNNGILIDTTGSNSISQAIKHTCLELSTDRKNELSLNARCYIEDYHSLNSYHKKELNEIENVRSS